MTAPSRVALYLGSTALAVGVAVAGWASTARAYDCTSSDPAQWPPPAKPYFMLVVDTSGSMVTCTTPPTTYGTECNQADPAYHLNSCGMVPNRVNDAKCALRKTVQAFAGEVNFGLSTFAAYLTNCAAGACQSDCGAPTGGACSSDVYGCTFNVFPNSGGTACGNVPSCAGAGPASPNYTKGTWRNGGNIVVPMEQDQWWGSPQASNVAELLKWFDGDCTDSKELFAGGSTPIAGALRSAAEYMRAGWSMWTGCVDGVPACAAGNYCSAGLSFTDTTFMDAQDRACRSVNVILVTDGDDNCCNTENLDGATAPTCTAAAALSAATAAAADLYTTGVTLGTKTWPVKTWVINFAGGTQANTDAIAAAGGTTSSLFATNEVTLAQGLSTIISTAIKPETCNNADDNCNGCTDEGYAHYCNVGMTCCPWTLEADRQTCLTNYRNSIPGNPPNGNLALLPCTTAAQQQSAATWLCYNPGDACDNADNNCDGNTDEGQTKCGSPLHCPTTEVCNGLDDNCNGQIDEGVCGTCHPSPETCDGCDNDCDGWIDNPPVGGFPVLNCGLPTPANCQGTQTCQAAFGPVPPGTCLPGHGYAACSNHPGTESCNGVDDDCNGLTDDGLVPGTCTPSGNPPGLHYGPPSICQLGTQVCAGTLGWQCQGGTGPQTEVCDGVDNDCDGLIDNGSMPGTGNQCGSNNAPCQPGTTQCVNGALTCVGGVQPGTESCNGVDDDCDGQTDETPLSDGPLPGQGGCWDIAGPCCSHGNLHWCPPPGANCGDIGSLSTPCHPGTLTCAGAAGWICVGAVDPGTEVCNGIDDNCNGQTDEGSMPGVGVACGPNQLPCVPGMTSCVNGGLECVGGVPPTPEVCDNVDNDCDGLTDNGLPPGGPCMPPYDAALYPGNRNNPPCQQGVLQCQNGNMVCVGGVGPSPEICDGVDNDCDGAVDESGGAPDGVDGTANPTPPPNAHIGDACGVVQGACTQGHYACLNGLFACVGGVGPVPEQCDCTDNDCDGLTDEAPDAGEPALCSTGKDCVSTGQFCMCAQLCGGGEYPCPTGQDCKLVTISGTGQTGNYCIPDVCGDCASKTVHDAQNNVVCAPAGGDPPGCVNTPVCVCRGQAGCREPCYNIQCTTPMVCSNFGPTPGQCVTNSCHLTGCEGCNRACHGDVCVDNPCEVGTCPSDQVCKPSADWSDHQCLSTCADVQCDSTHVCVDGTCVPSCDPPCDATQTCDLSGPTCVPNQCLTDGGANPCADGACCLPVNGSCGDCPCDGVVCPDGQSCAGGQCTGAGGAGGSGGTGTGGSGTGGSAGHAQGGSGQGGGNSGANVPADAVWRLSTGGGGCLCATGPGRDAGSTGGWLALGGLMLVGARRRRSRAA